MVRPLEANLVPYNEMHNVRGNVRPFAFGVSFARLMWSPANVMQGRIEVGKKGVFCDRHEGTG